MSDIVFSIQSAAHNIRAIERYGKAAKPVMRKAVREGAKELAEGAKDEAPVLSGRTAKAIKVRAMRAKRNTIAASAQIGSGFFTGQTFAAAFVHFGHKIGKRSLGSARKSVPANPFMERGFKKRKPRAVDRILAALKQGLRNLRHGTT